MTKQYKLKQERGVLHIGGGRFFYPGIAYSLEDDVAVTFGNYFDEDQESSAAAEGELQPGQADDETANEKTAESKKPETSRSRGKADNTEE